MAARVRRQVMEVEVLGTESEALTVRDQMSHVCETAIAPALESAFDRIAPAIEEVVVERLSLDLPVVSMKSMEVELATAVADGVRAFFRDHPLSAKSGTARHARGIRVRSRIEAADEAFFEFLGTGRLPWSFQIPTNSDLEECLVNSWRGASTPADLFSRQRMDRFRQALMRRDVRNRVLTQFSSSFVGELLRWLSPEHLEQGRESSTRLSSAATPDDRMRHERRVWDQALSRAAQGQSISSDPLEHETLAGPDAYGPWPAWPKVLDAAQGPIEVPGSSVGEDRIARDQPSATALTDDQVWPQAHAEADEILVDNAGLVLVHAYLDRFFEAVGVEMGAGLGEADRAVCLLHLIATGESIAPEHEVTLSKVMCGVPIEQPVESDVGVSEQDEAEAVDLLRAVIEHWGVLRNTSPNGLRNEFLRRPGQLSRMEGGWLLRVESRASDILLDQLPWSLSLIRLPWMESTMRVAWRE